MSWLIGDFSFVLFEEEWQRFTLPLSASRPAGRVKHKLNINHHLYLLALVRPVEPRGKEMDELAAMQSLWRASNAEDDQQVKIKIKMQRTT